MNSLSRWPLGKHLVSTMALAGLAAACGGEIALDEDEQEATVSALIGQNGLDDNGLNGNGLNGNGLNSNGLNSNGLNGNGLNSNGFKSWFNGTDANLDGRVDDVDLGIHQQAMGYLVACACSSGTSRSFTDAKGSRWSWAGKLGLAQNWCAGYSLSTSERQRVTACMAAHVNQRGLRVTLSLTGLGITSSSLERELWSMPEAAFYGDLWRVSNERKDRSATFACRSYEGAGHRSAMGRLGRQCGMASQFLDLCQVTVPMEECATSCSYNSDRTVRSCTAESSTHSNVLSTFVPQRMELGDYYSSVDGTYRRCTDQHWAGSCSANPLQASKSSNARWDVLKGNASRNFTGSPREELEATSGFGTYVAQLSTSSTSWIRVPNRLATTGTRTLNFVYTSPSTCALKVSVNDGASYTTVSFPTTGDTPDGNFRILGAQFSFSSRSPVIVLSSLANGTCAPLVDWMFIST